MVELSPEQQQYIEQRTQQINQQLAEIEQEKERTRQQIRDLESQGKGKEANYLSGTLDRKDSVIDALMREKGLLPAGKFFAFNPLLPSEIAQMNKALPVQTFVPNKDMQSKVYPQSKVPPTYYESPQSRVNQSYINQITGRPVTPPLISQPVATPQKPQALTPVQEALTPFLPPKYSYQAPVTASQVKDVITKGEEKVTSTFFPPSANEVISQKRFERLENQIEDFNKKYGEGKQLNEEEYNQALSQQASINAQLESYKTDEAFRKKARNSDLVGQFLLHGGIAFVSSPFELAKFGAGLVSNPVEEISNVVESFKEIKPSYIENPAGTVGGIVGGLAGQKYLLDLIPEGFIIKEAKPFTVGLEDISGVGKIIKKPNVRIINGAVALKELKDFEVELKAKNPLPETPFQRVFLKDKILNSVEQDLLKKYLETGTETSQQVNEGFFQPNYFELRRKVINGLEKAKGSFLTQAEKIKLDRIFPEQTARSIETSNRLLQLQRDRLKLERGIEDTDILRVQELKNYRDQLASKNPLDFRRETGEHQRTYLEGLDRTIKRFEGNIGKKTLIKEQESYSGLDIDIPRNIPITEGYPEFFPKDSDSMGFVSDIPNDLKGFVFLRKGLPEGLREEVIAHELGHIYTLDRLNEFEKTITMKQAKRTLEARYGKNIPYPKNEWKIEALADIYAGKIENYPLNVKVKKLYQEAKTGRGIVTETIDEIKQQINQEKELQFFVRNRQDLTVVNKKGVLEPTMPLQYSPSEFGFDKSKFDIRDFKETGKGSYKNWEEARAKEMEKAGTLSNVVYKEPSELTTSGNYFEAEKSGKVKPIKRVGVTIGGGDEAEFQNYVGVRNKKGSPKQFSREKVVEKVKLESFKDERRDIVEPIKYKAIIGDRVYDIIEEIDNVKRSKAIAPPKKLPSINDVLSERNNPEAPLKENFVKYPDEQIKVVLIKRGEPLQELTAKSYGKNFRQIKLSETTNYVKAQIEYKRPLDAKNPINKREIKNIIADIYKDDLSKINSEDIKITNQRSINRQQLDVATRELLRPTVSPSIEVKPQDIGVKVRGRSAYDMEGVASELVYKPTLEVFGGASISARSIVRRRASPSMNIPSEIDSPISKGISSPVNPLVNLNPSINVNPLASINPQINPQINPLINPQINPLINPQINPLINPQVNPLINPLINPNVTPNPEPNIDITFGEPFEKPKKSFKRGSNETKRINQGEGERGYNVYVKLPKRNKFIKVTRSPVSLKDSKDIRNFLIDESTSRSGYIKQTKKKISPSRYNIPVGYSDKTNYKFRTFKQRKGKRIPLQPERVIERGKYLIDTMGEKKQLSIFKAMARAERKKSKSNKPSWELA